MELLKIHFHWRINNMFLFFVPYDTGDGLICGISIDWKTMTQFFVTLAYAGTTFKFVTYWVSIGY